MRLKLMRRTAFITLATLVVGLTVAATANPAAACSCMSSTDEEAVEWSDAVFTGTVLEIREDADTFVWLVGVESILKGDPRSFTTVETPQSSATCGTTFPLDTLGVFFVNDNNVWPAGEFKTGLCSPSRAISSTEQVLPERERTSPEAADSAVLSGFSIGVVDDAPDSIEAPTEVADERVVDDGEVEISEQDQAELAAQGGGPETPAGDRSNDGTTTIVVVGLVGLAVAVLVLELRRRPL